MPYPGPTLDNLDNPGHCSPNLKKKEDTNRLFRGWYIYPAFFISHTALTAAPARSKSSLSNYVPDFLNSVYLLDSNAEYEIHFPHSNADPQARPRRWKKKQILL
jgi:hypothetical protein